MLRQTFEKRKDIEDQVRQAIEPIKSTLRFIAELQAIYQEVYGTEPAAEISVEPTPETAMPAKQVKPKTKKEVLFSKPKVELPLNAKWQDLTLSFINTEDIEVKYGDTSIGKYSHEDLGFAQSNTEWKKPDRRWGLLEMISAFVGREPKIPATKQHLMNICGVKSPNAVEKRKSDLSMGLRQAFGIKEEPFEKYSHETGYQPKFTLLPEKDLRGNGELHRSGVVDFNDVIYQDD
tara:strand:+ start:223 stop:924 length:702 start_codon:yes stop_codon:yes gene_type:complete